MKLHNRDKYSDVINGFEMINELRTPRMDSSWNLLSLRVSETFERCVRPLSLDSLHRVAVMILHTSRHKTQQRTERFIKCKSRGYNRLQPTHKAVEETRFCCIIVQPVHGQAQSDTVINSAVYGVTPQADRNKSIVLPLCLPKNECLSGVQQFTHDQFSNILIGVLYARSYNFVEERVGTYEGRSGKHNYGWFLPQTQTDSSRRRGSMDTWFLLFEKRPIPNSVYASTIHKPTLQQAVSLCLLLQR